LYYDFRAEQVNRHDGDRQKNSNWGAVMSTTVAQLCQEQQITLDELVRRSGLEDSRVQAIIEGRWTPSPEERRRIAAALNATVEEIVWGHKTPIQHLWGHGPT
jgi:hypothetical protein